MKPPQQEQKHLPKVARDLIFAGILKISFFYFTRPGAQFKEPIRYIDLRTTPNTKKCYCAHLVKTHPKFVAQILQHRWILNIVISHSLVFCSFGKTFYLERLCLKVKQSTCNLWMKQRSMLRCLVPTASVPYLPLPCTDTGRSQSTLGAWSFPSMWTREIGIQSSGPPQTQFSANYRYSSS